MYLFYPENVKKSTFLKHFTFLKIIVIFYYLFFYSFPWLKTNLEDSEIENNTETDIGFSSLCKIKRKESVDERKNPSCSNQEDLNCSAMSDFLNDISFTDLNISKYENSDW